MSTPSHTVTGLAASLMILFRNGWPGMIVTIVIDSIFCMMHFINYPLHVTLNDQKHFTIEYL